MSTTAIVCAWRNPEDDRENTLNDSKRSHGKGCKIISVEDKDGTGPGCNRDRGIMAADGCDVVIVVDAHMRFRDDALRAMAKHVRKHGGLVCAATHHNDKCSFTDPKSAYWGARMIWRARDRGGVATPYAPLVARWAKKRQGPGEVSAVMGACYAFRRDWYIKAGRPLAILRAWGCDEEVLSIAAWMTGQKIEVVDRHVAHLYRSSTPWKLSPGEIMRLHANRLAMVNAFVTPISERNELTAWLRRSWPQLSAQNTPEQDVERLRIAMLNAPRRYTEWRKVVCEPPEDEGVTVAWPAGYADIPAGKMQDRIPNPVVITHGIRCPHCGTGSMSHPQSHTYPNGARRYHCAKCGGPFIAKIPPECVLSATA